MHFLSENNKYQLSNFSNYLAGIKTHIYKALPLCNAKYCAKFRKVIYLALSTLRKT